MENVNQLNFQGLSLDCNLNFKTHTKIIGAKIAKTIVSFTQTKIHFSGLFVVYVTLKNVMLAITRSFHICIRLIAHMFIQLLDAIFNYLIQLLYASLCCSDIPDKVMNCMIKLMLCC